MTALFAIMSLVISLFVLKPQYEATATILVQSQNPDANESYSNVITNQNLVVTYEKIMKSNRIAEKVRKELNLPYSTEDLLSNVYTSSDQDSLITSITVRNEKPEDAARISNTFATTFQKEVPSLMNINNVAILDKATFVEDQQPVSPNIVINTLIALLLGGILGIIITFLIDFLDQTVKSEEEVELLLQIPVLGIIPKVDEYQTKPLHKSI